MSKLLTLQEVADLLQVSRAWAFKSWPQWIRHGVHPIRLNGSRLLRFRADEIEKMLKQMEVVTR